MASAELRKQYEHSVEVVHKIKNNIDKHINKQNKILEQLKKNGWEQGIEDDSIFRGENFNPDALSLIYDYNDESREITTRKHNLEKAEEIMIARFEKLLKQIKVEKEVANEVPEAMKEAMQDLIETWVQEDLKEQEKMFDYKKTVSYKEFIKTYKISRYEFLMKDEDEFRKIETKNAEGWMLDLYNRVKEKTGKITDCSELHFEGKALNGTVKGEKGTATVETIGAGGYNIQKYHLRVLVK